MPKNEIKFSQILSAIKGKEVDRKQLLGSGGLEASKSGDAKIPDSLLGSHEERLETASRSKSARTFIDQAGDVLRKMGYNEAQIHHYLIDDDPKKAGMSDWRTTEKIINNMRQHGVSGFKEMDKLSSGRNYGRRLLDQIDELQKKQKTEEEEEEEKEETGNEKEASLDKKIIEAEEQKSDDEPKKHLPINRLTSLASREDRRAAILERYRTTGTEQKVNTPKPKASEEITPEQEDIANPHVAKDMDIG